jgi:hypothetical protein
LNYLGDPFTAEGVFFLSVALCLPRQPRPLGPHPLSSAILAYLEKDQRKIILERRQAKLAYFLLTHSLSALYPHLK